MKTPQWAWVWAPQADGTKRPWAFLPLPCLCLQGEPGPPGQTGPEGPGGQQGSPGTQGRTVQGPMVSLVPTPHRPLPLAPLCPPCCPVYASTPGSARGQRREGGPWTPRPAGSGVRPRPGTGGASGQGPRSRSGLASASVLFQGTPGKVGLQGPKVKGKPTGEGLGTEGGGGLPPSAPTALQPPRPLWPGRGWGVSARTWRVRPELGWRHLPAG